MCEDNKSLTKVAICMGGEEVALPPADSYQIIPWKESAGLDAEPINGTTSKKLQWCVLKALQYNVTF